MTLSFLFSLIISLLRAIIGITFFTLFERKILGYIQLRKGPNKVGFIGLPQPIADAIKLFTKEHLQPFKINVTPFIIAPIIALTLSSIIWILCPNTNPFFYITYSVIIFITISRINVYTPLIAGWASNSKYALLGSLRRLAQTISYEITLTLIILSTLLIYSSFIFYNINLQIFINLSRMLPHLLLIWFISILAETNRAPFDFAEGESEIVSGFNIEYNSSGFALLFIAEYIIILVIRIITVTLFFTLLLTNTWSQINLSINRTFYAFLFVWTRGSLPRIRYDHLIYLTWKRFLPTTLCIIIRIITLIELLF